MIPLVWEEIAALALGALDRSGNERAADTITGIKADSRTVGPGDLFVAYVEQEDARFAAAADEIRKRNRDRLDVALGHVDADDGIRRTRAQAKGRSGDGAGSRTRQQRPA